MVYSMTGFGAASGEVDGVQYSVEIRSVNHRYLKATIKLPESWAGAETDVEQRLRKRVQRGSVLLAVRMKLPEEKTAYQVNPDALGRYIDQLRPLEIDAGSAVRIDLAAMLQLPGVCEPPPIEEIVENTRDGLMDLIDKAITGLLQMRKREGDALAQEINGYCDVIDEKLGVVVRRAPLVVEGYRDRLQQRLSELLAQVNIELDQDVLTREVIVYAERCDVAEEISRLGEHVRHFRSALKQGEGPAGRRLDFIAQEMLREANTIASKANDSEIGQAVVEIKTAIDRIKEQVQNVE